MCLLKFQREKPDNLTQNNIFEQFKNLCNRETVSEIYENNVPNLIDIKLFKIYKNKSNIKDVENAPISIKDVLNQDIENLKTLYFIKKNFEDGNLIEEQNE